MGGVALLTLHGMGETDSGYEVPLLTRLRTELTVDEWEKLTVVPLFYEPILRERQVALWNRMEATGALNWKGLRNCLFYGFSDAAGLEYARTAPDSAYEKTQRVVLDGLRRAYQKVGADGRVVIIAQSLGGDILSNYLWDAGRPRATAGIWRDPAALGLSADEEAFCRGGGLSRLITTGCVIPIFRAGLDTLVAFDRPHPDFRWLNLFDPDDPLGWPLRPLGPTYEALVDDFAINAANGFWQTLRSETPLAHQQYWTDEEVVGILADAIRTA